LYYTEGGFVKSDSGIGGVERISDEGEKGAEIVGRTPLYELFRFILL
jgi:hypothetical protein